MGFFSSVGSALCSIGSAICSAISSLGSTISRGISSFATVVMEPFKHLNIEKLVDIVVETIGVVIDAISTALGLKEEDEKPEEIAMKAEKAEEEGIKPENFDSYEEYINYIRKNIELEENEVDELSKEDRVIYSAIGSSILVKGIEEKIGIEIPPEFVIEIGKLKMSIQETKEYIKLFKEENLDLGEFSSYLNGDLDEERSEIIGTTIESAIKNLNPNMTEEEVYEKICDMKEADIS